MSAANEMSLPDSARAAFSNLAGKQRAGLLKQVAHSLPKTIREVLRKAHIPGAFQPERIERWMQAEQQQRIERVILAPENEDLFDRLLRGFFSQAHPVLNDRLLRLIDPRQDKPLNFDAALDLIQREFPQDSFALLYVAATRWISKDAIQAHAQLLSQREEPVAGKDLCPEEHPSSEPGQQSLPFAALDASLEEVRKTVGALHKLQPMEAAGANAELVRAAQSVKVLSDQICALAVNAGESKPTWKTREEFNIAWKRLSEVAEKRHSEWEHTKRFKAEFARRLETVEVRHRLPRRKAELCALARRAQSSSAA